MKKYWARLRWKLLCFATWLLRYYKVFRQPIPIENPPTAEAFGEGCRLKRIVFTSWGATLHFSDLRVREPTFVDSGRLFLAGETFERKFSRLSMEPGDTLNLTWNLEMMKLDED